MKLAFFFLILFGWFYLSKKIKNASRLRFPLVNCFLGIMVGTYVLIMLFMMLGLEQSHVGFIAAGCAFAGSCFALIWYYKRVNSKS